MSTTTGPTAGRSMETVWNTGQQAEGGGTVMVVLGTHHWRDRKELVTDIRTYTEEPRRDSGFTVRKSRMEPGHTDVGVRIKSTVIARYNVKVLKQQHLDVLADLRPTLEESNNTIAQKILELLTQGETA